MFDIKSLEGKLVKLVRVSDGTDDENTDKILVKYIGKTGKATLKRSDRLTLRETVDVKFKDGKVLNCFPDELAIAVNGDWKPATTPVIPTRAEPTTGSSLQKKGGSGKTLVKRPGRDNALARKLWRKACRKEGVSPAQKSVEFSMDNPFLGSLRKAISR